MPDATDACPSKPGLESSDPATNGCPPEADADGDGFRDDRDACPQLAGPANVERYGQVPPFTETRGFVRRVLEVKELLGQVFPDR